MNFVNGFRTDVEINNNEILFKFEARDSFNDE